MSTRSYHAAYAILLSSALGCAAAMVPHAGWAQAQQPIQPDRLQGNSAVMDRAASSKGAKEALPPALPGARSNAGAAAPAARSASDMSPNDALFDAINRGDMAAVRDAVNRGADLNTHNVLGLTPAELSVDLGRNDITFLLLSMRGETKGTPKATQPATAAAKPPVVKAAAPVAPAKVETPRLYANDGGTPIPNAGFLGFGSGRTTR